MIRKAFKVGDTITIKRTSNAGTGYHYALVHLNGGAALISETIEATDKPGDLSVQSFTFQFLQPGLVEIQFAYYRDAQKISYEDIFPYLVVAPEKANTIMGGWSEYEPLTEKDKEIFDACMNLQGMDYMPLLTAKQLVNGNNYRFFCLTKSVTSEPKFGFAEVTIYAPREGEPVLESIIAY